MKARLFLALALVATLLIVAAAGAVAQNSSLDEASAIPVAVAAAASEGTVSWFIDTVDGSASDDRGQHVSVAIDPSDGTIYVSYYDATDGDLRWARTVSSGGNCGPDNAWYCETVASTGDVGRYSSIAVYPGTGPADWKVGIAYHDAGGGHLKYAEYTYDLSVAAGDKLVAGGGGSWAYSGIDLGNASLFSYKGRYISLAFDSGGTPHISYYHYMTLGDDALRYARYVGSGGNCGSGTATGQWRCNTIHAGPGAGQYTAISLANGVQIAFLDGGSGRLMQATYTGIGGYGCSTGASGWVCSEIESSVAGPVSAGGNPATGRMHIAYVTTGNKLKYAVPVSSGGNCGPSNTWYCEEIEGIGADSDARGVSLAIDDAGYPVIAYQRVSLAPESLESLKVARPAGALGWVSGIDPLNCGGEFTLFATWYCETVDAAGYSEQNGDYASAAVSPAGLVTVAYYEQDALNSTGYLQVAYQRVLIFLPLVLR